jgi:hypothetical protein
MDIKNIKVGIGSANLGKGSEGEASGVAVEERSNGAKRSSPGFESYQAAWGQLQKNRHHDHHKVGAPQGQPKGAEQRTIAQAQKSFQDLFGKLAGDKTKFDSLMKEVYGPNYDTAAAESFRQRALKGDYSWLPKIEFKSEAVLQGGNGAFDASRGVVYINDKFMNDPATAAQVYSEETGHFLDTKLNKTDTVGDEGEMFRRLLHGEKLTAQQKAEIRADDDHGVIYVNGKATEVEFWNPFKAVAKAVTGAAKAVGHAVTGAAKAVGHAVTGAAKAVGHAVTGAAKAVGHVASSIFNGIKHVGSSIGKGIKHAASSVFNGIKHVGSSIFSGIKKVGGWIADGAKAVAHGIGKAASTVWHGVKSVAGKVWNGVKTVASKVWDGVKTAAGKVWDGVKTVGSAVWTGIKKVGGAIATAAKWVGPRLWDAARGLGTGVWDTVKGAAMNVGEGLKTFFGGFGKIFKGDFKGGFKDLGMGLVKTFVQTPVDAVLMMGGRAVSAIQTLIGVEAPGRKLTDQEIAELKKVYGDSIDYSSVRIKESDDLFTIGANRTHGNVIHFQKDALKNNPSVLIHEMAHVWQFQHGGTDYMSEALWAQAAGDAYNYAKAISEGKSWSQFDPEQQAELLEDAYRQGFFNGTGKTFTVDGVDRTDFLNDVMKQVRAGKGAP